MPCAARVEGLRISPAAFRSFFARHWRTYEARHGPAMPASHRRAATRILACRTSALGGHLFACPHCGDEHHRFHSCNHRLCPLCGAKDASEWAARQRAKLLPVPYRMVTFTVPGELRRVFRSNPQLCDDLFFHCCAATLQEIGGLEKYLGGRLGFLGVLHTWNRQLEYHPHIHFLVAEAGLENPGDGSPLRLRRPRSEKFFLPVKRLSINLRTRMQRELKAADPEMYRQVPPSAWAAAWVCHIGQRGDGAAALHYLARYVARSAMSLERIVRLETEHITLAYTDSRDGRAKTLRLHAHEFLRRFLQHVLPTGFRRVRAYGWLAPAAKKSWIRLCAILEHSPPPPPEPRRAEAPVCPRCRLDMVRLGKLPRAPPVPPRRRSA